MMEIEVLLRAATTGALRLAGTTQGEHDSVLEEKRERERRGEGEMNGRREGRKDGWWKGGRRGREEENKGGRAALCNSLPSSVVAMALLPRVEPLPLLTATCTQHTTQVKHINAGRAHNAMFCHTHHKDIFCASNEICCSV